MYIYMQYLFNCLYLLIISNQIKIKKDLIIAIIESILKLHLLQHLIIIEYTCIHKIVAYYVIK